MNKSSRTTDVQRSCRISNC